MYRHMKGFLFTLLLCLLLPVSGFTAAHGSGHTGPDAKGPAILLVTFGTSVPSAKASFDNIDKLAKEAFPKVEVRWAYTSSIIRNKLAKQGTMIDSPEVALAKMMAEGYSKVAVQSLHMIPGAEFHDTYVNAKMFGDMVGGFKKVIVSYPLLASNELMDRVVDLIIANMIPTTRTKDEAVVLMGHGTHHPSDAIYSALMYKFQKKDANIYVGTVEGSPTFAEVKDMLVAKGIKKAYLIPLMSVAGDHSINDMAGEEDDSWKNMLKSAGIESVPLQKGVAEYDALANVWIDNLKNAMKHLQ
ncbi:MAG: sirohydrochlorin cobaltochelatase [Desulfobulbus sp.]|nr:sirohydrochlorin cobaltochelatase [Desulfobulbus sp.]